MMKLLTSIALVASVLFFLFTQAASKDLPENPPVTDTVYFDIEEDGHAIGRITIGLFGSVVPKTVENFKTIAASVDPKQQYTNSVFHRVIKNFMIQGGDYEFGQGYGGQSIYGKKFEDENFDLKHDRKYRLSMANAGRDTNGSQFFITTAITNWLDGKHVVFGEVLDGKSVVDYIESVKTGRGDRPVKEIKIAKAGLIGEEAKEEEEEKEEKKKTEEVEKDEL
ncbi:uncharacterized protein LODBEIA_P34590 [Lodderomyces beijingensis]|uniref:Peptidyl-prolyl cis-trans isomerase n=1 Tax=Lodderomyces beijingensis TaxID=1775926 RepID=A0ABP0ZM48_9ASCO